MNFFVLSAASIIPAILLCWYIYVKDRVEKEPFFLLLILFLAGAAIYMPAYLAQNAVIALFDNAFAGGITYTLTGVAEYTSTATELGHSFTRGFLGIALIEEAVKWVVLILITSKRKDFNSLFDGIVYSVFVGMGFAAVENIRYGFADGWDTFFLRAVTNVPAQLTFAVMMGFFYTLWHTYYIAKKREAELGESSVITVTKPFKSAVFLVLSIIVPFVVHGVYSFVKYVSADALNAFYTFIIVLYIICFVIVHKMSEADSLDEQTVLKLLHKKYPDYVEVETESVVSEQAQPESDCEADTQTQ